MMTKQLSLSPDQVAQVKAIMDLQNQQVMALRDGGGPPTGERREQMMAIRQASSAKIRALLTDDQKAKFDAMEARMQNRQRGGGSSTPPPPSF
jgi:Spy/CpxP family protein refolding chaperone